MVFTVFNRDSFTQLKEDKDRFPGISSIHTAYANRTADGSSVSFLSAQQWEEAMRTTETSTDAGMRGYREVPAYYADEIKPFNVTITLHNEYGNAARFSLYGCEILNEGSGMSIDDISTEKACTFVARSLSHLQPIFGAGTQA